MDKDQYVREHYLQDALESLAKYGRYWNGAISRTMAGNLNSAIKKSGIDTLYSELPPQWEHVYYLSQDASLEYFENLRSIAVERFNHDLEQKDPKYLPV